MSDILSAARRHSWKILGIRRNPVIWTTAQGQPYGVVSCQNRKISDSSQKKTDHFGMSGFSMFSGLDDVSVLLGTDTKI